MIKPEKVYKGPQFLAFLALGCVGFIALMLLGTWIFAQLMAPVLERSQKAKPRQAESAPPSRR